MRNALVIGGGAVGLAIAGELADIVDETYLVDKESSFGEHGSSRSSEVIHSGIYYRPGSLKAKLCVEGNKLLQEFCQKYQVQFHMAGKIIVARNEKEIEVLRFLKERAEQNGVPDTEMIDERFLRFKEPNVIGSAGLLVPTSGVFDSAQYLHSLESIATAKGVCLLKKTKVIAVEKKEGKFAVTTEVAGEKQEPVFFDILINAAGVYADKVAQMINPENDWKIFPVKCESMYFRQNREGLNTYHHVYPTPVEYVLPDGSRGYTTGVHTTWKPDGRVTVGPFYSNTQNPKKGQEEDYTLTLTAKEFLSKINDFFPNVKEQDLQHHQAGIQPKLKDGDFILTADKNYQDVFHCVGIDSPGITASVAIPKIVKRYFLGKEI